jgi:hypothetical protein
MTDFLTLSETALFFEVDRGTIGGLVKAWGLKTIKVKANGKAKGLCLPELRIIAKALGKPAPSLDDVRRFAAVA